MLNNLIQEITERFPQDIQNHVLTVIKDEGIHRHLTFKQVDSSSYWFEIVTWPGTLCIKGDMGAFVFSRIPDMFNFFGCDDGAKIRINPGYWSEKIEAGNFKEFSAEKVKKELMDSFKDWEESTSKDRAFIKEEKKKIKKILSSLEDEIQCWSAIRNFETVENGFDIWGVIPSSDVFTYRYIWCCFAIVWGIEQYKSAKVGNTVKGASV